MCLGDLQSADILRWDTPNGYVGYCRAEAVPAFWPVKEGQGSLVPWYGIENMRFPDPIHPILQCSCVSSTSLNNCSYEKLVAVSSTSEKPAYRLQNIVTWVILSVDIAITAY